jgi:16S rRNA (adenine1518-N6/adenine1519-N6)-dimethyltransferase
MQTLTEIRELLEAFGLAPQKRFGQNFLFDQNLLGKIVELAEVDGTQTVLEVGPGTGSLTEELLQRAGRVVSVEIDNGLFRLLSQRLADRPNLVLLHTDVLAGKHAIEPKVIEALGTRANLVANLPYNIATPIVAQCLISSWQALVGKIPSVCRFDRLTFTVQQEVAQRMVAPSGSYEYGPVSVIVSLLGKARFGPVVPNTAFWPKPQVVSRAVRIDFDPQAAGELADVASLKSVLSLAFNQRRKQIGSVVRRKNAAFAAEDFWKALETVGIDRTVRAEQITPHQFRALANALAGKALTPGHGVEEETEF